MLTRDEPSGFGDKLPPSGHWARVGGAQVPPAVTSLWVGLPPPIGAKVPGAMAFASGSEALAALRLLGVDLVIVGSGISDMSAEKFARRLRCRFPRQRWLLVAPELAAAGEIAARALGAAAVLDTPPAAGVLR